MNTLPQSRACPICQGTARFYCCKAQACYYRCRRCDAIFLYPPPSSQDMISYADQEYTGGLYWSYIQARDLKYATFRRRIPLIRKHASGLRLLDVGCSCGYFIDIALQEGLDAYGVEFSAVAIAAASDQARPRIMQGDVQHLAATHRSTYDIVTAFDIIEHTHDPVEFLRDLSDALRPRGLLVLTTPDTKHFLRSAMRSRWPMLQPLQHIVLFSDKALRLALSQAGFTEIEFMPAKKVITIDYLMQQIKIHNPLLARLYGFISPLLPAPIRSRPISVNIGELILLARRGN